MTSRSNKTLWLAVILMAACLVAGCAGRQAITATTRIREAHEQLNSVLWVRFSPEYEAVCRGAFTLAMLRLDEALAEKEWTALPGQAGAEKLPPAVILDVDETVLDNSAFEARLILEIEEYNKPMWDAWIAQEAAPPVPGARGFIQHARDRGVQVFFVTNRDGDTKRHTVANLRNHFGPAVTADRVLTRGERADWTSDKTSRRTYVAANHRILLLVGDNLNDFTYIEDVAPETRVEKAGEHSDLWGTKWIMLPNPMYGTWEQSLYGYDRRLDRSEKLKLKHKFLEPTENN